MAIFEEEPDEYIEVISGLIQLNDQQEAPITAKLTDLIEVGERTSPKTPLSPELQTKIDALMEDSNSLFYAQNWDQIITLYLKGWESLPEPKSMVSESFHLADGLARVYLTKGQYKEAEKWGLIFQKCDLQRIDDGDKKLVLGMIYHDASDFEQAMKYLKIANKKSSGYCFIDEDPKYKQFFVEQG